MKNKILIKNSLVSPLEKITRRTKNIDNKKELEINPRLDFHVYIRNEKEVIL